MTDDNYMNRIELITRVTRKQLGAMSRTKRERFITFRRNHTAFIQAYHEDAHFLPAVPVDFFDVGLVPS